MGFLGAFSPNFTFIVSVDRLIILEGKDGLDSELYSHFSLQCAFAICRLHWTQCAQTSYSENEFDWNFSCHLPLPLHMDPP